MSNATSASGRWHTPTPAPRTYRRRKPSLARNLLVIGAVAFVLALAVWGGLAAQMSAGGDPALGGGSDTQSSMQANVAPPTVAVSSGDDEDEGESDDGAVVISPPTLQPAPAPTTSAPAQSTPTSVQTSVS